MNYFIKSWKNDLPWLVYCLRSVAKFDPKHHVTLVLDHDVGKEAACVLDLGVNLRVLDASAVFPEADKIAEGYVRQQYIKLCADRCYPETPHVQLDSDMVMLRPPTDQDFYYNGLPLWFYREWADAGDAQCWLPAVNQALGYVAPYEFMMRPGFILLPKDLARVRRELKAAHEDVPAYLNTVGRRFSEYNVIGTVLWEKRRETRSWFAKTQRYFPDHLWPGTPLLEQAWSYGGIDAARRARYEELLR